MKKFCLAVLAAWLVLGPASGWAQQTPPIPQPSLDRLSRPEGPVAASLRRDHVKIGAFADAPASRRPGQEPSTTQRSWIGRHPVVFGALVGAGAGLVAGGTMNNELICQKGNDEDCLFYNGSRFAVAAGIGAGIGALIGWIAGR